MNVLRKMFFAGVIAAVMPQVAQASTCSASGASISCDTLDLSTALNSLAPELSLLSSNALSTYQNYGSYINYDLAQNQNNTYGFGTSNTINISNTFGLYANGSVSTYLSFSANTVGNLIKIYASATEVYASIMYSANQPTNMMGLYSGTPGVSTMSAYEYLSGVQPILVASYSGSIPATNPYPNMGGGGGPVPVPGPIAGAGLPALLSLIGIGLLYRRQRSLSA